MNIIKHKEQRVAVLMDVQNMYHSAKNIYGARVNFKEVLKTAVGSRKLIRAIAYVIHTETPEEKTFFDALVKSGLEVKMKDLQVFAGGMKKGDWDVGITVDAIKFSSLVDAIVLVTGDGDFVPLVEYLKLNKGIQTEAIAFEKSASAKLKEAVDDFVDLSQEENKYLIKSRGNK
ncbi:NYN domain-containing protein [Patescibacteria group bacterium]|nr:NYN domain-containing protein [Patescibacteria group bacterium]MBU1563565.1 NYN domain-containing protein [Patescibacteria group bacterium]MBU2068303.1 NYN domain-containing protein [Patescibacteria group bacterium]